MNLEAVEQTIGPAQEIAGESLIIHMPAAQTKKNFSSSPVSYRKQICIIRTISVLAQALNVLSVPFCSVKANRHFRLGNNTMGAVFATIAIVNFCAIFINRKIWGDAQKNYASCEKGYTGKRSTLDNLIFFPS